MEGSYVYRLNDVAMPIEETFARHGQTWLARRRTPEVTLTVAASILEDGSLQSAQVEWSGAACSELDVRRERDGFGWRVLRSSGTASDQSPWAERHLVSDAAHVFLLLRCFQGVTVRALAEAGDAGLIVVVPDITDPTDEAALLAPRVDRRRASLQGDGSYVYVGGSYEEGAVCEVGDDGLLDCYRWDQPGTGLWDVRLRRSRAGTT